MNLLPLFPLKRVLFPGCRASLQIFEQRYLKMVTDCLKSNQEFVIVWIIKGSEVGVVPEISAQGTMAKIVDWNQLKNGLLGITVLGTTVVTIATINSSSVREDGLMLGQVVKRDEEPLTDDGQLESLVPLLKSLQQHPFVQQQGLDLDYSDPNAVLW